MAHHCMVTYFRRRASRDRSERRNNWLVLVNDEADLVDVSTAGSVCQLTTGTEHWTEITHIHTDTHRHCDCSCQHKSSTDRLYYWPILKQVNGGATTPRTLRQGYRSRLSSHVPSFPLPPYPHRDTPSHSSRSMLFKKLLLTLLICFALFVLLRVFVQIVQTADAFC